MSSRRARKLMTVVGQAPSRTSDADAKPFKGRSGDRIAALSGNSSVEDLEDVVVFRNLLRRWPGRRVDGRGDRFPPARAKAAARAMKFRTTLVVFAGTLVAKAFSFDEEPLVWREFRGTRKAAVIPHPSGVNRFWNEPENVRSVRVFFALALWKVGGELAERVSPVSPRRRCWLCEELAMREGRSMYLFRDVRLCRSCTAKLGLTVKHASSKQIFLFP